MPLGTLTRSARCRSAAPASPGFYDGAGRLACLLSLVDTWRMLGLETEANLAGMLMECKRRRERKDGRRENLTPYRWAVSRGGTIDPAQFSQLLALKQAIRQ